LALPQGINFDRGGNLYIADTNNNRIRKLTPGGIINTFAGTGISGYTGDGGAATSATLYAPMAVAADLNHNVYIADQFGAVLRQVNSSGTISTNLATGQFFNLYGLATDAAGNVYAADPAACVVWKITSRGAITPFSGDAVTFNCGYNGDNIPATQAWLNAPMGVAVDTAGNVYIADDLNNRIRVVSASTGNIQTSAGNGTCGFSGDGGPATAAMICCPYGVGTDTKGNVYIADTGNARIREVDPTQTIQTVVGTGSFAGYNGNGLPALQTNLDVVYDVVVNPAGVLYWSDYEQYRVRKAQ